MKLFTFATSPYARKVRMALDYKGVSYEPIERCYSIDRKEDLRCVNLRAEVPTLVLDDGRMIADSTIICEYIEDAYPQPPLCPKDSYERARMRMIEDLCDRAFDAASFGMGLAMLRNEAPEASAIREAASKELRALLGVLDCELGEREFFCGDLSLADLAAVCHVHDARELPRLHAWMQRMRRIAVVSADHERFSEAVAQLRSIADEFEGPDGRVHWRDSRLEWPVRHGFIDFVAREFHAGKMMFPPDAS